MRNDFSFTAIKIKKKPYHKMSVCVYYLVNDLLSGVYLHFGRNKPLRTAVASRCSCRKTYYN